MNLKKRIEELCKENGTSIWRLERDLKIGNGTIRRWDKSSPSFETAVYIAEYFGISVNDLVPKEEK